MASTRTFNKQSPKWEIGETVRAMFTRFDTKKDRTVNGYRRGTITFLPEGWMKDAAARITVTDDKGESQKIHFSMIWADWKGEA